MNGVCRANLHYTFDYAHALHSSSNSLLFFHLSTLIPNWSPTALWFLSAPDWLSLTVCFARRDMFQTNTWIRERGDTL